MNIHEADEADIAEGRDVLFSDLIFHFASLKDIFSSYSSALKALWNEAVTAAVWFI